MTDENESPASFRASLWAMITLVVLMLYLVGSGVTHGLYYTQYFSDQSWEVIEKIYAPMNWLESKLGEDNIIFRHKYWWYIKIQYGWDKEVDFTRS
jgi:hypothetical protein